METLADVLARDRRSDAPALRHDPSGREYDYRRLLTSAWKTGNLLQHLGVREGARVAVAADPVPETVLGFLGAGLLGGVVTFGPEREVDARVLLTDVATLDDYAFGPATKAVVYGGAPDDPSVHQFERDVWSENPTMPPNPLDTAATLLAGDGATYTHGEMLTGAREVADTLENGDRVVIRSSLSRPGVVCGLLAPLLVGGVVVFPDEETVGDVAIGDGPEDATVAPESFP